MSLQNIFASVPQTSGKASIRLLVFIRLLKLCLCRLLFIIFIFAVLERSQERPRAGEKGCNQIHYCLLSVVMVRFFVTNLLNQYLVVI